MVNLYIIRNLLRYIIIAKAEYSLRLSGIKALSFNDIIILLFSMIYRLRDMIYGKPCDILATQV